MVNKNQSSLAYKGDEMLTETNFLEFVSKRGYFPLNKIIADSKSHIFFDHRSGKRFRYRIFNNGSFEFSGAPIPDFPFLQYPNKNASHKRGVKSLFNDKVLAGELNQIPAEAAR